MKHPSAEEDPLPRESTEEADRRWKRREAPVLLGRRLPIGNRTTMLLIGVVVGVAGGLGAVVYRWLIGAFEELFWSSPGTPLEKVQAAPFILVILVPAVGGLLVGLITRFVAPEAKGHGVPEVMDAVARKGGLIRPVVVLGKAVGSAVCIASGGSVGREGPIVQIGSAVGSTIGRLLKLPTKGMRAAVACGAAAGIAGTFNAPIAGAFFAAEVILGHFASVPFGAVVIASVTSTAVARSFLGNVPAFEIPRYELLNAWEMLVYAALGLVVAGAAVAYVRALAWFEDRFDGLKEVPEVVKPAIGGLGVGLVGLALPQVMGVGYDTILPMLEGHFGIAMLLLLFGAKLLATTFTLGSGGSGGVFAPSLFMGAALGGAVGALAGAVLGFPIASPGAYAVVGMGAMVAAATHAPITAILIIFEMTGDYHVILGLMVSVIVGTLVSQRLSKESIYTIKLARRGIHLHQGQEVNVLKTVRVRDVMRRDMETVRLGTTLRELVERMIESQHYEFFVVDAQGCLKGIVSVDDIRHNLPRVKDEGDRLTAEDLMSTRPITVREDDTLDHAMRRIARRTYEEIPVLPEGTSTVPIGAIRRDDVIQAYNKAILQADLAGSVSARVSDALREQVWETVGGFVLGQLEVPLSLSGPSLADLQLRRRHGVEVLLVEQPDGRFDFPSGETRLHTGERILVFGERDKVREFLARFG